jgi:hypothetical protein
LAILSLSFFNNPPLYYSTHTLQYNCSFTLEWELFQERELAFGYFIPKVKRIQVKTWYAIDSEKCFLNKWIKAMMTNLEPPSESRMLLPLSIRRKECN